MKSSENYVDFKLFGCREGFVYEAPEITENPVDKLFVDDVFKVNVSYVVWSTDEHPFYKVKTPSGHEGYIRTDIIQLV